MIQCLTTLITLVQILEGIKPCVIKKFIEFDRVQIQKDKKKEVFCRQKSIIQWLKDGGRSVARFLKTTQNRRVYNKISIIEYRTTQ